LQRTRTEPSVLVKHEDNQTSEVRVIFPSLIFVQQQSSTPMLPLVLVGSAQ